MKHVWIGIAFIVVGAVVVALQPAMKKNWERNGQASTRVRVAGNALIGVLLVGAGVAVAAGALH